MLFTISKGIILQVQMDFQGEGESEVCVSWLFSVGTIQAVLLKKKPKHILIAKLNAY